MERLNAQVAQLREKVYVLEAQARAGMRSFSERGTEPGLAQMQHEYRLLKDQCHSALLTLESMNSFVCLYEVRSRCAELKTERGSALEQNKELTALVTQLRKKSIAHRK